MKLDIDLNAGETLHVFQKPLAGAPRSLVTLTTADGAVVSLVGPASDDFTRTEIAGVAGGRASLDFDAATTAVSLAYAFLPAEAAASGIRVLHAQRGIARNPARYRLHFTPPFGWMNDPNGLSQVGGRTHLFYQHYPHSLRWNTMHWGHAVTANGIDWVDQPIFLLPRPELLADDAKSGGAFSGSAVALPDGRLRVYYTDREDDRLPNWEWQMTAVSDDLIGVGPVTAAVTETPVLPGFGKNFRDPYVFRGPDGLWKMLLGAGDDGAALVLLYETEDATGVAGWRFVSVLHSEATSQKLPAECPCMVPLDGEGSGLHVLIFGMLGSRDEVSRRRNITLALVGRFDGRTFRPIVREEIDYGTDCYAFQAMSGSEGPFGIAWAANWTDVFKERDFPSAMTFPRRLVWKDGAFSTPPVDAVSALRLPAPPRPFEAGGADCALKEGLAEIEIGIAAKGAPFALAFRHASFGLLLDYRDGRLELRFKAPGTRPSPRYDIEDIAPEKLRIFVDVGLIEIYVDDGRWCITKRIDSDEPVTAVSLAAEPGVIAAAVLRDLRPQGVTG